MKCSVLDVSLNNLLNIQVVVSNRQFMYKSEVWVRARGISLEFSIQMVFKAMGLGDITWGGNLGQSCPTEDSAMMEMFCVHVVHQTHGLLST